MKRINSTLFAWIAFTIILGLTTSNAFAQSRTANAVTNFISIDGGTGMAMAGCGGPGGGDALSASLDAALGQSIDDESIAVENRRTSFRLCDIQTATGANGWSGDLPVTAGQATVQAIAFAPEEVFATMDNANSSFNLQTANVARRLALVRLSRRIDRNAAEQLAKSSGPANDTNRAATGFADRGPAYLSAEDRGERILLALQEGINAGDEIGGEGLGFFLNGRINVVTGEGNPSERGSDGFGGGFTFGADKSIGDEFFVGIAVGYTHIDTNFNNSASDSSLDAATIAFYGAYFPTDEIFVDGSFSVAYLGIETSNEIVISDGGPSVPSLDGEADGVNVGFDIGVGYSQDGAEIARMLNFDQAADIEQLAALSFEPFVRLSVLYTEIEDFNQTGGDGSLNLEIDTQQTTSVTTSLGFRTDYAMSSPLGVFTPYFRVAYIHEFVDENDDLQITSVTAPGSPSFKLKPEATDSNYANIGVGVSATLGHGFSEFIDYDVIAGHENVTIHQITAGMRLEF